MTHDDASVETGVGGQAKYDMIYQPITTSNILIGQDFGVKFNSKFQCFNLNSIGLEINKILTWIQN